jgi:hypothetical protein
LKAGVTVSVAVRSTAPTLKKTTSAQQMIKCEEEDRHPNLGGEVERVYAGEQKRGQNEAYKDKPKLRSAVQTLCALNPIV